MGAADAASLHPAAPAATTRQPLASSAAVLPALAAPTGRGLQMGPARKARMQHVDSRCKAPASQPASPPLTRSRASSHQMAPADTNAHSSAAQSVGTKLPCSQGSPVRTRSRASARQTVGQEQVMMGVTPSHGACSSPTSSLMAQSDPALGRSKGELQASEQTPNSSVHDCMPA